MLEALAHEEFETTTIWTEGLQHFAGVPLKLLLDTLGVSEGELSATAINDYAISLPVSEALIEGPLIAYERNGRPMSVRDKGPLWLVYPYDHNREFQTKVIYSRSIWQLDRIAVTR